MALINKITVGFVVQVFDTEKGKFISQEFMASDDTTYEIGSPDSEEFGEPTDNSWTEFAPYISFDMVQPT